MSLWSQVTGSPNEPPQVECVNRERNTNAGKSEAKWMETDAERMEMDVLHIQNLTVLSLRYEREQRHHRAN